MARSRWELEENRKKKKKQEALNAVANAVKQGKSYKATPTEVANTVKSASTSRKSGGISGGTKKQNTTVKTSGRSATSSLNLPAPVSASNTSTRLQDLNKLNANSIAWHKPGADQDALKAENDTIRAKYGWEFDPRRGVTFETTRKTPMSNPQRVNLSLPATRLRGASLDNSASAIYNRSVQTPQMIRQELQQEREDELAKRQQSYDAQTPLSVLGHNTMAGIAGINKAAYSTLDFLLPDIITPEFIQKRIDAVKTNSDDIKERVRTYNYSRGGTIGGVAGDLYQSAIEMVPQAVVALMTGGASETAQAGQKIASAGNGLIQNVTRQVMKNPAYWSSFLQTVGTDYENAKQSGASDTEAAASAILSSALNAGVEIGGGIETMQANPNTIKNWIKSAAEEGREEVAQGIISGLTEKGIYDPSKPWITVGTGEGVLDPVRAAQEFGAGALLGGVAGAGRFIAGRDAEANTEVNSQALGQQTLNSNTQNQMDGNISSETIRNQAENLVRNEMQRTQQETIGQNGTSQTQAELSIQVPADAAFQYGLSPEAAILEARERARNEAAQSENKIHDMGTVDELMQAWTNKKAAEQQAEQTLSGLTLTQNDIEMAQNAARTGVNSQNWEETDNPENARIYGSALRAVREADRPIRQFFAQRASELENEAQTAADAIALYAKDKRFGGLYQRETMERNIRDIFGKEHQDEAEYIIKTYITPVHKAVANGNKLKNRLRGRVKALKLDRHESALTQMLLENETAAAEEYIQNNKIKMTPQKQQKIDRAVTEFRVIYNELYQEINQTLLLNGQEPAPFRKNYAPHFVKDKPDTIIGRVRFALGLGKDSTVEIPTDIAGITETFRPGKKWFGNLLQREGEITDYDAVAGFDRYVETAADVITLTDSIQRLRALEDQVRYTLSDAGVKKMIDQIKTSDLDALAQREQIEKIYDENKTTVQNLIADITNQKRMGMGRFVTELRRYTDNLAGKKSREDRGWEDFANRQIYSVAKKIEGRVAANMISLNPGSWLTNFIPITQASGEVSVPNLIRGMYQTIKSSITDDGYVDASAFLTNRYGSRQLDRTLTQKVSDVSGAPMEILDHFTANTIHRARYAQNIDSGMSINEAIDDADSFTAALMADRSKGALPTVFNSTNPVRKVFTMFQVEVNNQLSYLFKDMPKEQRQKGAAAIAWAFTKVFAGAYFYNLIYSQITGRDAAFDPIGMIADALEVGEDDEEKKTASERLEGLAEDIGGQIPFVGGILFDGGRVPLTSAIPNLANLGKAIMPGLFGVEWTGEKRLQTAAKELAKPATYLLPPFGGGAIKKAIEGFATVNAGGSYTYDNNGDLKLQFPAYGQSPLDYASAMIFGKWSSKEAQQYIESGFKGLSANETRIYNGLRDDFGVDPRKAMDAVMSMRGFESVKNDEGKTIQSVKEQQRRALFDNANLTPEQKQWIDKDFLINKDSDEQPADYSDYTSFVLSMFGSENRRAAAEQAVQHGLTVDQFVQWDDRMSVVKAMTDRTGKTRYSDAQARKIVLDEVMNDTALTNAEKESIADYVLISSMNDTQQEKWDAIRGQVNASDFIQFSADVSEYKNEFAQSGADNTMNVAQILRNYSNLTNEQRDALFQTYSDNMSKNPFHISVYEKNLAGNRFFEDLTDTGKSELRALANEYEQAIEEGKELNSWEGKAYMAQEAGIAPETYILYRVALSATNADGEGSAKQSEAESAVNLIPGLTQQQKAYLYQSTNSSWKSNPFGSATVTAYNAETQEAINPVSGGTLSSSFGPRSSPTAGASSWHKAVDIAAPAGTPVQAVKSGTVTSSGWVNGYGWTVHIDHGDGTETEYHHMQAQSSLKPGDTVEQGQQIGAVGSTGISTGPHLDLQAWQDGHIVDPLTIIPEYGNASGYVYDGNVSPSVTSSNTKKSAQTSKKSSSTTLKGFDPFKAFAGF